MTIKYPILITAGGTGGHVYPGLAVARELIGQGIPVIWMGTAQGLEARVIPHAGIEMATLQVSGLRGKGWKPLLLAPLRMLQALWQAWHILRTYKPVAVLGMGGFVAGPGGLVAALMGIPVIIHEQNAIAGLTNRLLVGFSRRVLAGFPSAFKAQKKLEVTGNPVRRDIAALMPPEQRMGERQSARLRLLVVGGSLGAQALNRVVPQALAQLPNELRPEVRHQAGAKHHAEAEQTYADAQVEATILPFIENMAEVYAWADLVICRAGALTIAELAAAGVGSILVPYPHAVDDHQTANARYLSEAGAALLMPQATLTAQQLAQTLLSLIENRATLVNMAKQARCLAKPDATARVAEVCAHYAHYPFNFEGTR